MTAMNPLRRTTLMVVLAVSGMMTNCYGQQHAELSILGAPVNESTAVRLFFNSENYFHAPLILRVVASNDPRLNTAPMLKEGRTAYISETEMLHFMQGLQKMGLSWKESKERVEFGDATKIPPVYAMVIVAISSGGTAEAGFDPAKICENLAPLDAALSTPRALWEFQLFRSEYKCRVPGLDGQAYPDHWPWNTGSENSAGPHPKQQ
jgi:hypothetical protein